MSLKLYQRHPYNLEPILNNEWIDGETPYYKVHTPTAWARTTTVSRALVDGAGIEDGLHINHRPLFTDDSTSDPPVSHHSVGALNHFIYVAQIEWKLFKSTKIRFGTGHHSGTEALVKDFLKKEQLGRYYVFTGEDGKEYKWNLGGFIGCKLTTNDTLKTPIAVYHPNYSLSPKRNHAYLEIMPEGQHMIDEIFVTFIYVEQPRQQAGRP